MRTTKQGRAAASWERGPRRRTYRLPGPRVLVRGTISPGLSHSVERYHPCMGQVWAFLRKRPFFVPNAQVR